MRFVYQAVACTLYPLEAMVAPLGGRAHALEFIEALIGFINDLHARRKDLTPSHKIHQPPVSVVEIMKALPRTNCRACGYPTCMAFAAAIRSGKAAPQGCPDFAPPISVCAIYPVFGSNGEISATLAIETPSGEPPPPAAPPREDADRQGPSASARAEAPPLYDRHGLRIQYDLSPREKQVLRLIKEGASNPEISAALNISPHTVKSHVVHIFNKLNVNDRTQAAVWAVQNQVV